MKRIQTLLTICTWLFPFMVSGQHVISEKIQQNVSTIQQAAKYTPLTEVISKSANLPVISKTLLSQKQFFQLKDQIVESILDQKSEYLQMTLPIEGQNVELQLMKADILTDDFRVVAASNADEELDVDLGTHYWGTVKGKQKSLTTISFFEGEIVGTIHFNNNQYTLGKVEGSEYHILYNTKNLNHTPDFSCEAIPVNDDDNIIIDKEEVIKKSAFAPCVRIHVELDNNLFQQLGGTQNSTNYMNGVFAEVATLYANENISIQLSFLRIWDTPSPYGPGDGLDALTNQGYGRTYGDLVHLVRSNYGGGVAYLNVLCTSSSNTGSSGVFGNFQSVPTYSWDVNVIAHELGHNFGSPHTHACSWSGGAIDGCGPQAGFSEGCNGPIPSNGGTIMSYCHLINSVNFTQGFGPQPGNLIRSRYNNASCLEDCSGGGGGGGEPTCDDGIRNGDEIGTDCGGPDCPACPPETCSTYNFNVDPIIGYDAGQDFGTAIIQDGGATVFMDGNVWKALQINYTVTPNTLIEFDFRSTVQGEIHEVGFDNDLILEPNHRMVVYGNQGYDGTLNNPVYTGNGNWQPFAVNIGAQFTGTFTYLVLTADDDANAAGNSYFRNIKIYEDNNGDLQCDGSPCGGGNVTAPCVNGFANGFPCNNIDLVGFLSLNQMACSRANDIWGWTDPQTGKEYAIFGCTDRTTFIDISTPTNPVLIGTLLTNTSATTWRDMKVFNNHAFIVSEAGGHGMQVFNLTRLRNVNSPVNFNADAVMTNLGAGLSLSNSHNIVLNEQSGYVYTVGSNTCSGGLTVINVNNPTSPTFAGCFSSDGYTHDAQCVNYIGPDGQYTGREICFNSNENTLTIVDVTDKSDMTQISRTGYAGQRYTHQGWLTDNHEYFLMNDELDESQNGHNTRTHIWDVRNLDSPVYMGFYQAAVAAIDHNLYIKGNKAYMANYRSGLRILDISNIANADLQEVAYFDTYPQNDAASFNSAWSNYPYFASGNIIVSDIEQGLFILRESTEGQGCLEIELYAYLEGPHDNQTGQMTNALNSRGLLPGQTPANNLITPIPAGQPYNIAPWNYTGTEGANWTDANYTGDEVDWILVSFRTGIEKNTEVDRIAALLKQDGRVEFPTGTDRLSNTLTGPVYVVLEHRNHIGVMTTQPVSIVGNRLFHDFRTADSYRDATSVGQKEAPSGIWYMLAGDASQMDFPSYDVNLTDKTEWTNDNGTFDNYASPDFNMDGDINGNDKAFWEDNNGFSSRVPK